MELLRHVKVASASMSTWYFEALKETGLNMSV